MAVSRPAKSVSTTETDSTISMTIKYKINYSELDIAKKIGAGSFGSVFSGKWNAQQVAIKIIPMGVDAASFADCEKEKDILQRLTELNAPNIITFCGFGINPNEYFIVTEYMPKGSLSDYIDSGNYLGLSNAYNIIRDVAIGLDFLHQLHIVHRDVKTGNILLGSKMEGKLCDLGCAHEIDDTIEVVGSLHYTAPELYSSPYTEKADIFSLAVVLFEIAAGGSEFLAIHPELYFASVCNGKRRTIPVTCEQKIAKLVTWGWQQNPENRPTAKELLQELSTPYYSISEKLKSFKF